MTRTTIDDLDRAIEESDRWVEEIQKALNLPHLHRAYTALRSVLQAVRDTLPSGDALDFALRLPIVIRGAVLEGWKPSGARPPAVRTREEFLTRVAEGLRDTPGLSPASVADSVFKFLAHHDLLEGFWPLPSPEEDPHVRLERTKREIELALAAAREEGVPVAARRGPPAPRPPRAPRGGVFDRAVHKVLAWVKNLRLQRVVTRRGAFRALVAVLRALRDRLTTDEAFHLGAQLPMILRGFYFDGWRPGAGPLRERRKEEFLARVEEAMNGASGMGAEIAARAVFALLGRRVTEGEIEDVRHSLPEPIRELWPTERAPSRGTTVGGKAPTAVTRGPGARSRRKKARRGLRSALARARASGLSDLPVLLSRKSARRSRRGNPW